MLIIRLVRIRLDATALDLEDPDNVLWRDPSTRSIGRPQINDIDPPIALLGGSHMHRGIMRADRGNYAMHDLNEGLVGSKTPRR